jgi:Tfp pilus assembly protein PilP
LEKKQTAALAPQAGATATVTQRPNGAVNSTIARNATLRNAIRLNQINLIGVSGKPNARNALVRLKNGRYRKVTVGDRLDGGRVTAIGRSDLRYSKSGRQVKLDIPSG